MPTRESVSLDRIRIDGNTQSRAEINVELVSHYQELIEAGANMNEVIVFWDGKDHWLADGFHRLHATRSTGKTSIFCMVYQGTRLDAVKYAASANYSNGAYRTARDKSAAVKMVLAEETFKNLSVRIIAEMCKVSKSLVAQVAQNTQAHVSTDWTSATAQTGENRKVTGSDGKVQRAASEAKKAGKARAKKHKEKTAEEAAKPPKKNPPKKKKPDASTDTDASDEGEESASQIPRHLGPVFEMQTEFRSWVHKFGEFQTWIDDTNHSVAGIFLREHEIHAKRLAAELQEIVKFAMPHAVCSYCGGKG